jgi:hypothetical protein
MTAVQRPPEPGICCTATRVETAVREKVGDAVCATGFVSRAFADSFGVSAVSAPHEHLSGVAACAAAGMTVIGPPRLSALTVI